MHIELENLELKEDRILIKPIEVGEQTTNSGIILPGGTTEAPTMGEVIRTGPGKKDQTMDCKVGDTVIIGKYAGMELEINLEKFLIIRMSEVVATF